MKDLKPKTILTYLAIIIVTSAFSFVGKDIIDSFTKIKEIDGLSSQIRELNQNIEDLNKKLGSTDFKVELNENEIFYLKGKLGIE